jgi:hypothetical protein
MGITPKQRQKMDSIITEKGYTDCKWIDPKKSSCPSGCV